MRFLAKLSLLLAALVANAAVIPIDATNSLVETSSTNHQLVKRDTCANGLVPIVGLGSTSMLLCVDPGTRIIAYGYAIQYVAGTFIRTVADAVVDVIASKSEGTRSTSAGRRLTRREEEEEDGSLLYINIGGVEAGVPFTQDSEGKTTINVVDFFTRSRSSLDTRDVSDSDATVIGGTATYYSNGTLDTFTLDFSLPSTASLSDSASSTSSPILTKRNYGTIHTTYWATHGHSSTSLNRNALYNLVYSSYSREDANVSQVCGYMANSGTWHGAFRHWTGDSGYSVGECERARKY